MLLLTIVSFTLYSERSQRVQLFVSIIRCKTQRQRRRRFMLLLLLLSISASWEKIRSHRRSSCRSSHAARTMTTRSGGRWRYVYARHFGSSFRKKWRSFLTAHSSLRRLRDERCSFCSSSGGVTLAQKKEREERRKSKTTLKKLFRRNIILYHNTVLLIIKRSKSSSTWSKMLLVFLIAS